MCITLAIAHNALAHDWYNLPLATMHDPEWLVHSVYYLLKEFFIGIVTGMLVQFDFKQ